MRHQARFCLFLLMLALTATSAHAEIYKWVEDNGTVTFRDTPPPQGKEATVVARDNHLDASVNRSSVGTGTGDAGMAVQAERKPEKGGGAGAGSAKQKDFPAVELYVTSWCGYCKQAKAFLTSRGVPFKEYDIERDSDAARRMKRLNARGGVPFAVIGDKTLAGFFQPAYQDALGLD